SITLTGSDADGDTLKFCGITAPAHGTLTGVAPNFVYKPATNYFGNDQFTFKVNDGHTNSLAAIVFIKVMPVNDAPVARISISPLATFKGYTNLIVVAGNGVDAQVVLNGSKSSDIEHDALSFAWYDDT